MKSIEAIIKPFRLEEVRERVCAAGATGFTVCEVRGFGRTGGKREITRGSVHIANFVPKVQVQCFVADEAVRPIVDAIIAGARTGDLGDGKITISELEEVIRIRTNERGNDAL
jgi:nitrogen regulatory protein P-II 1